jgi:DNA polymerase-1
MRIIGWDVKSQLTQENLNSELFDCMIAEYLITYGQYLPDETTVLKKYKVTTLEELSTKQQEILSTYPELNTLFHDVEMKLIPVLWKMEQKGITLDKSRLETIGKEIDQKIVEYETDIKEKVGYDINLNSPTQIGTYLAEKENVPLKKTKTGKYATNESELSQHSPLFPIIQQILAYRGLAKLRSTYVDSLIIKVGDSGRVHTTYHQTVANTGRLASTNPNLQNIPVTSEFGQKIKSCFEASPGTQLVSFDYSQQELRILAHLTNEEVLIDAFNKNKDVHKTTASQIFSVNYDEVTKQQRTVGKTINFGIIYGMSSYGLSTGLNIPVEQAQQFIDTFYTTYPKIKKYYDQYFIDAKKDGFASTMLGRRRNTFEYPGQKFISNSMHRVLLNYPIQGSAADLMKKAMIDVDNKILRKRDDIFLLLQIHDDLVFEINDMPKDEFDSLLKEIHSVMCSVYPLSVPIDVEIKKGTRWAEMEPLNQ